MQSQRQPEMNPSPQTAPSVSSRATAPNPHFGLIGGVAGITRLVERFYHHMDARQDAIGIRTLHAADLVPVKRVLVDFLTEWMGGPQAYSAQRGHPRLRRKHLAFRIGPAERDAWMACMHMALQDVVPDAALGSQLEQAFLKTAEFLRNDQDHHHDHHR